MTSFMGVQEVLLATTQCTVVLLNGGAWIVLDVYNIVTISCVTRACFVRRLLSRYVSGLVWENVVANEAACVVQYNIVIYLVPVVI